MTNLKQKVAEKQGTQANIREPLQSEQAVPIIANIRPGLADSESTLMRRLPTGYADRRVSDVLTYIVESEVKPHEKDVARSLKQELGAAGSLVVINGKNARLTDKVGDYLVAKSKDVDGRKINYQELEIEVSAVQQGGYRF